MDKFNEVLKSVILLILLFLGSFLLSKRPKECPPEGKVLIDYLVYEQLVNASNKVPDTITRIDTFFYPDTVLRVYSKEAPQPIAAGSEVLYYEDSLVNEDISLFIYDSISTRGLMLSRQYAYQLKGPKTITQEKTITKEVPVLQPAPKQMNLYWQLGVGSSAFGGEVGVITRRDWLFSGQYLHASGKGHLMFKAGKTF